MNPDDKMDSLSVQEAIEKTIKSTAEDLEYLIYEFSIYLKRGRSIITVKIDHLNGISHTDCGNFSRELNSRLIKENILPDYSLEISSPGVNRKVRSIEEFIRFTGKPVKVVFEGEEGRRSIKGAIKNVIDTIIELKSDKGDIKIDFKNIVKANLE